MLRSLGKKKNVLQESRSRKGQIKKRKERRSPETRDSDCEKKKKKGGEGATEAAFKGGKRVLFDLSNWDGQKKDPDEGGERVESFSKGGKKRNSLLI